jgi:hypothetical protein
MEVTSHFGRVARLKVITHRRTILGVLLFMLMAAAEVRWPQKDPPVIDRDVAIAISRDCAFYENVLYVSEGSFRRPWAIKAGPPRKTMPGVDPFPEYLLVGYDAGWYSQKTIRLDRINSIRCASGFGIVV